MRDYLKLGLTLFIICAIAAGTLAAINSQTAPVIEEATKQASYAMYYEMYGDNADDFQEVEENEYNEIVGKYDKVESVLYAMKDGEIVGYVFTAKSNGYGGEMVNAIGFDLVGNIVGYRNISNAESPGFGDAIGNDTYHERYIGKSVEANDELTLSAGGGPNEIEAISGSTVTSKAVIEGLNQAVKAFVDFYREG